MSKAFYVPLQLSGFTVDYSNVETFRDISLSGRGNIDASGLGGGDIQVSGNNISITDISGFSAVTLGSIPGNNINVFAALIKCQGDRRDATVSCRES